MGKGVNRVKQLDSYLKKNLEFLFYVFNHLVMVTLKNESYRITQTFDIIKNNR